MNEIVGQNPMVDFISKVASDPNYDIEKLKVLIDLKNNEEARQAKLKYDQAFSKLQKLLPIITKNAEIKHNNRLINTYATLDNINLSVLPILNANGFSLIFRPVIENGQEGVKGIITHESGHSEEATLFLPPDPSGNKSIIHAKISTMSYIERQLTKMMLNITTEDGDDDAQSFDVISMQDAQEIKKELKDLKANVKAFLDHLGISSVDSMKVNQLSRAKYLLKKKRDKCQTNQSVKQSKTSKTPTTKASL